jgi:hypothetical protein
MRNSGFRLRRIAIDSASALAVAALLTAAQQSHAQQLTGQQSPGQQSTGQAADAPAKKAKPAKVAAATARTAPSSSVVINLIRLLVEQGVLSQDKANALIRQAQDEAAMAARGQTAAPTGETPPARGAPVPVRVPYIPEIVKRQIRDQLKQEVMQQARDEHWAAPDAMPEWTERIRLSGDFRLRQQWDLFDKRNVAPLENFAALNSGNPYDLNNQTNVPLPLLDTTNDRERQRVRFRLGLDAELDDDFSVGLRLATGNTTNPVSTNQTLGNTLADDTFDLDRAFIRYHPESWATFWAGRFPNPWFSTDLVWDEDVNFDGVAAQFSYPVTPELATSLTLGVFPIENTAFNLASSNVDTKPSRDKWLYGGQAGAEWRPDKDYALRVGLAYYNFQNVEGELSSPCFATTASIVCDTDNSRPGFMQQGNTLFALRDIVSTTTNTTDYQYFGLASKFHELNLTARFDYAAYDPVHLLLDLDFVTNLGFNRSAIAAKSPVNNLAGTADGSVGPWDGGENGFQARLTAGYPVLRRRWDWNLYVGYKYLESDAVLDAFTDSEFHLGGTNAKGYFFGGGFGIARNVDLSARWYSSREITGPPYSVDTVQVDLSGRF